MSLDLPGQMGKWLVRAPLHSSLFQHPTDRSSSILVLWGLSPGPAVWGGVGTDATFWEAVGGSNATAIGHLPAIKGKKRNTWMRIQGGKTSQVV